MSIIKNKVQISRGWKCVIGFAGLVCFFAVTSRPVIEARVEPGVHPIIIPELKYLGNSSCAGTDCHTADSPKEQTGQMIGDEANIWAENDPHALAYETLNHDESKKIATALKIADASASSRCLSCHAMDAPRAQQGEKFAMSNAVGCESCHGPAEKYLEPHKKAGWTAEQRKALGAMGLLNDFGLVDTSHLAARAHTCVSCHLQIDKDMIDAGHPPLEFELYAYNYYISKNPDKEYYMHWGDGLEPPSFWDARLWAAGQLAASTASQAQIAAWKSKGWATDDAEALAAVYAAGKAIVTKRFGADEPKKVTDAAITGASAAAAAKDLAATAGLAKSQTHRRIIANGMAALVTSALTGAGKDTPDAFWDDYYNGLEADNADDFNAAINAMAARVDGI